MKSFYTSVVRYSNYMLYRGYSNTGENIYRKDKFSPEFYVKSEKETGWKSLSGLNVGRLSFDTMREAKVWLEDNKHVANRHVFGNPNYIQQYITSKFPKEIEFDRSLINVATIDIETEYEDGFPHPRDADQRILAITLKSSKDSTYHVWGYGDYDTEAALIKPVKYIKCKDEVHLLQSFLDYYANPKNCPDVITGWNTRFFDMPYLINRTAKILDLDSARRFSPWDMVDYRKFTRRGREEEIYDIKGVQVLDYLELFQKFGYTYGPQESYKLNHIAYVVLGEKKLSFEESGSLRNLYKDDFQKYIDYNMKDVQLVDRIEEKMGLITLAMTIAYKGGVNYQDTFGTTAIWESIIYRKLNNQKIVPPAFTQDAQKSTFAGGYVKEPQVGAHDWVVSFDLNSLYPNLIVQYNMSPETLINQSQKNSVEYYLNGGLPEPSNYATAANGSIYMKTSTGVIPSIIEDYYSERSSIKKMAIASEKEYQKTKDEGLQSEINTLSNQQMAIKILMNSLYGALGNAYFKYFDLRLAEGVTLSGQLAIQWAEKAMNKSMNEVMKTDGIDYVIAIDTDSLYINFGPLVRLLKPKNPVNFLDQICVNHFEPALKKSYDKLFLNMNAYTNRMEMGREVIADKGIWTAKKRYILNVHNSEGVQYAEPKLKIMGIEAIKSSTPEIVRGKFKEAFKIILSGTEADTQKFIRDFKEEFFALPPQEVAFPRGITNLTNWMERGSYKKGTPIHARGSILYNKYLKQHKLTKKYELITNGDRIKFTYLKMPNSIQENVISFPDVLPEEFKLHKYINYDLQFEKTFIEPLNFILHSVGWNAEEIASLDDFFA